MIRRQPSQQSIKGFTIIELVVVITIIGLLIAMSFSLGPNIASQYRFSGFVRSFANAVNLARTRAILAGANTTGAQIEFQGLPATEIKTYSLEDAKSTGGVALKNHLLFKYNEELFEVWVKKDGDADFVTANKDAPSPPPAFPKVEFAPRGYTQSFLNYEVKVAGKNKVLSDSEQAKWRWSGLRVTPLGQVLEVPK